MRTFCTVTALHLLIVALFLLKRSPEPVASPKLDVHTVTLIAKKPIAAKPIATKPTAAPKPTAKPHNKLKKLLQQSIDSLDYTPTATTPTVTKVGKLKSESLTITAYETMLSEYLQQLLELPEEGEVKLQLTLNRSGRVTTHRILSSSTTRNHAYVDKEIAQLQLPPFESHFKGEQTHTFPIVLKTY